MKNFDELLKAVEPHPLRKVAVAVGQDSSVIQAAQEARRRGIAECVLVGDEKEIQAAAGSVGASLDGVSIVHEEDILVVPDIECGNMLAKSLVHFGGPRLAAPSRDGTRAGRSR